MCLKFNVRFDPSLDIIVSLQCLTLLSVESPKNDSKKFIDHTKLSRELRTMFVRCLGLKICLFEANVSFLSMFVQVWLSSVLA